MLKERGYITEELFNSVPRLEEARILDVASGLSGRLWKAYGQVLRQKDGQFNVDQHIRNNLIASDEFFKPGMLFETPDQIMASDARSLPYRNSVFDVVTLGYLFDLLSPEEQTRSISEVHRVLRPEGSFIGDVVLLRWEPSYGSMWLPADERKKRCKLRKFLDKREFTKQITGYRGRILQAGFKMIEEGIGHTQDTKDQMLAYHFVAKK